MGLFSKVLQKVAPLASKYGGLVPGVGGIIQKVGTVASKIGVKKAGAVVAAGAGFELGGRLIGGGGGAPPAPMGMGGRFRDIGKPGGFAIDEWGRRVRWNARTGQWTVVKKHRAGLSGRDILGAQKVARVVKAFGYKPKIQKRKGRR